MKRTLIASGIVVLALVFNASATITFTTGNQHYTDVNFATAQTGATLKAQTTTGGQPIDVFFDSGVGSDGSSPINFYAQSGLVSIVNSADAGSSTPQTGFSSIRIQSEVSYGFSSGSFELDEINSGVSGIVSFVFVNGRGFLFRQDLAINPGGPNYYQFTSTDGDLLKRLIITVGTSSLMADVKGMSVNVGKANIIPEPTTVISSVLLLLPLGASVYRILHKNQKV
jgi:hypothetical protein